MLPPRLVLRDLVLTAIAQKGRIFMVFFCVMAIAVATAVLITPNYKAKSTLLVLMGTEHAFRPAAGQQFLNSGGVDLEQILRTEAGIIGSDDLHRSVIREIGLQRLYPKLLEKPGPIKTWIRNRMRALTDTLGVTMPGLPGPSASPLERAVDQFGRNLTITVDKTSSVIEVDFTNPDSEVAAEVLTDLETKYLALRKQLFGDVQAPIVQIQKTAVGKQLDQADRALQSFKQQHDISNFAERRVVLLRQQGDLEVARTKSEAAIAEQNAKLEQLNGQLGVSSGKKTANPAAALQGMVQAYRRREEDAQTRYRGSPAVDEARRQALERETDIARMQATQSFGIEAERNKTAADLKASLAGHDAITAQLADLNKQISALDADESQLHELERNRSILEDDYKTVSKILDERQTIEAVEANRESSVRIIQPPRAPSLPQPTRHLIVLAGLIVSIFASIAVVLATHLFRSIYLRPEALELDTGLTVLASVPEMRAISDPSSVRVVPG